MLRYLIEKLEALGYPVYYQGSIASDKAYPESFITYLTVTSTDEAHFDNAPMVCAWRYQITFYSSSPALVESVPMQIRAALKTAGFIPDGRGRDIPSDVDTHTGWTTDYYYIET